MLSAKDMRSVLDQMETAYRASNAAACAALFAENARIDSPFAPSAIGRQAIEALHADWTAEPNAKSFDMIDFASTDDMAWCLVRFSEDGATSDGTSLIVLVRQSDGWRIRACCLFGDPQAE